MLLDTVKSFWENVPFLVHFRYQRIELIMTRKIVKVVFYRTVSGKEPVKEWLLGLNKHDRSVIGTDIKEVEYGWPLGMPLVRSLSGKNNKDLWEVRSDLSDGRIARVIFTLFEGKMVLLSGFIKKTQKTPENELAKARLRMSNIAKLEK